MSAVKNCETRVHIVSTPLNLPLFLSGRTRFRHDYWQTVPSYIKKKKELFTMHCNEEKEIETRTERDLRNLVGIYSPRPEQCTNLHITKISRDLAEDKPWQLPPSTYDTSKEPFAGKRGHLGSYWRKIPQKVESFFEVKPKENTQNRKGEWKFYDLPRGMDRLSGAAHKHRGIFLTNARKRTATARCMISDPVTSYHNPLEPSPAHYDPAVYKLTHNISPEIHTHPPNPHIFLPHTSVPEKLMSFTKRHISFEPAVGRYETRFPKHCPCAKKILTPGLRLIIDREKRFKFRRLPYTKIKTHKLCYPDWAHVVGHGHRHLFRTTSGKPVKSPKTAGQAKTEKQAKTLTLYPDSKYINMINSPHKVLVSIRPGGLPQVPVRIRFNCIYKRVMRRQLRINKKIVFNSGSERFPELDIRPLQFSVSQLEKIKNRLPPERQLRDYPVMRKRLSEIKTHLYDTPLHMRPAYEPALRKRFFKFQPLPEPKVLVTEKELHPSAMHGSELQLFYGKPISPYDFMKSARQSIVAYDPPDGDGITTDGDVYTSDGEKYPSRAPSRSASAAPETLSEM